MRSFNKVLITVLFLFTVSACGILQLPTISVNQQQMAEKKKNRVVNNLMAKQDVEEVDFSMDRYLLNQRNTRFNDPSKMNYLYVCFFDGTWLRVTIRGKLASTSKRLTSPVKQYKIDRGQYNGTELGPAADMMGTHGSSNGDSKIGMTTLGSLLEFGGMIGYMYSEVPLIFTNMEKKPVEIELEITEQERKKLSTDLDNLVKKSKVRR